MVVQKGYFVAIRKTEGREWISPDEIGADWEDAEKKSMELDLRLPNWAKANPIQRIARIEIVEIRE